MTNANEEKFINELKAHDVKELKRHTNATLSLIKEAIEHLEEAVMLNDKIYKENHYEMEDVSTILQHKFDLAELCEELGKMKIKVMNKTHDEKFYEKLKEQVLHIA